MMHLKGDVLLARLFPLTAVLLLLVCPRVHRRKEGARVRPHKVRIGLLRRGEVFEQYSKF